MDANELASRVARGMLAAEGTGPAWGIAIEEARAGYVRLSMTVRADMLNGHRIVHGGMVFSLADTAFAYVCNGRNQKKPSVIPDGIHPCRRLLYFIQLKGAHCSPCS